jgi:hypothetical protein
LRRRYNKEKVIRHRLRRPISNKISNDVKISENVESCKKVKLYGDIIYNVCQSCNNNWMSELHKAAEPLVSQLADGFWPKLSHEQAFILSRWVTMIVINLENVGRIISTTSRQRSDLMNGHMPTGWSISAAKMQDSSSGGYSFYKTFNPSCSPKEEPIMCQATYFCIEKVAFHAVSAPHEAVLSYLKYDGISKQFLPRRVWPICDPRTVGRNEKLHDYDLKQMQETLRSPFNK